MIMDKKDSNYEQPEDAEVVEQTEAATENNNKDDKGTGQESESLQGIKGIFHEIKKENRILGNIKTENISNLKSLLNDEKTISKEGIEFNDEYNIQNGSIRDLEPEEKKLITDYEKRTNDRSSIYTEFDSKQQYSFKNILEDGCIKKENLNQDDFLEICKQATKLLKFRIDEKNRAKGREIIYLYKNDANDKHISVFFADTKDEMTTEKKERAEYKIKQVLQLANPHCYAKIDINKWQNQEEKYITIRSNSNIPDYFTDFIGVRHKIERASTQDTKAFIKAISKYYEENENTINCDSEAEFLDDHYESLRENHENKPINAIKKITQGDKTEKHYKDEEDKQKINQFMNDNKINTEFTIDKTHVLSSQYFYYNENDDDIKSIKIKKTKLKNITVTENSQSILIKKASKSLMKKLLEAQQEA